MNQDQLKAWHDAVYDAWVLDAVLTCAIKMPWPHELRLLVGYDPNLLLTNQRSLTDRVCDLLYDGWREDEPWGPEAFDHYKAFFSIDNEIIDFTAIPPGTPSPPMVTYRFDDPPVIEPELDYTVLGGGRLYFEHITHTKHTVTRWGESDTDPLDDIKAFYERMVGDPGAPCHGKTDQLAERYIAVLHPDMSDLEMQYLLAALRHETKPVVLDLDPRGGDIPGPFADESVFYRKRYHGDVTAGLVPRRSAPSYHRHDPTKSHKRTRR